MNTLADEKSFQSKQPLQSFFVHDFPLKPIESFFPRYQSFHTNHWKKHPSLIAQNHLYRHAIATIPILSPITENKWTNTKVNSFNIDIISCVWRNAHAFSNIVYVCSNDNWSSWAHSVYCSINSKEHWNYVIHPSHIHIFI